MPIYTAAESAEAAERCAATVELIREGQDRTAVRNKGWLALGYVQGVFSQKAISPAVYSQFVRDIERAEADRLAELQAAEQHLAAEIQNIEDEMRAERD